MSELTDDQMAELERDLRALDGKLREMLELSRDGARPVDLDQPIGRVSRIDAIQQQKMVESNRRASELRLRKVGAALVRLEDGDYGLCAECEEPIAFRRLKARPESRFCVGCQSAREQRG
jgi:DnaK suppressor protein